MMMPEEILDKKFEKGRGYDRKEVDDFIQKVYDEYNALYRRNVELQDQVHTLNSGLQHYKTIETSLQKALILAEKTADETIQTAKLRADSIIREAKNNAAVYTADSHAELEAVHGKTIGLMQEYVRYKAQFNRLIQEQLDLLNGSRFEIQTDDLLAFQKINEDSVSAQSSDTIAKAEETVEEKEADAEDMSNADTIPLNLTDFSETTEDSQADSDIAVESAIPETPSSVEVYPGYRVTDDSVNQLDYLNAAPTNPEE